MVSRLFQNCWSLIQLQAVFYRAMYYNHRAMYYNHRAMYYNHRAMYYNHRAMYYNHRAKYYTLTQPAIFTINFIKGWNSIYPAMVGHSSRDETLYIQRSYRPFIERWYFARWRPRLSTSRVSLAGHIRWREPFVLVRSTRLVTNNYRDRHRQLAIKQKEGRLQCHMPSVFP